MANNTEDIKWLYGKLKAEGYDIGNEQEFTASLQDDEDRSWYYDKAVGMGLDVGSRDDFNELFGPALPVTTGAGVVASAPSAGAVRSSGSDSVRTIPDARRQPSVQDQIRMRLAGQPSAADADYPLAGTDNTETSANSGSAAERAAAARLSIEAMEAEARNREDKKRQREDEKKQREAYEAYLEDQRKRNAAGRLRADEELQRGIDWDDPAYRAELDGIDAETPERNGRRPSAGGDSEIGFGGNRIRVFNRDEEDQTPYYARARVMRQPEDIYSVEGKVDDTYTERRPGMLPELEVKGVSAEEVAPRMEEYLRLHPDEAELIEGDAQGVRKRKLTSRLRAEMRQEIAAADEAFEKWLKEHPVRAKEMRDEDLAMKREEIRAELELERRVGNLDLERDYVNRRYSERRAAIEAEIRDEFAKKGKKVTAAELAQVLYARMSGDEEIKLLDAQMYNLGRTAELYEEWKADREGGTLYNFVGGMGSAVKSMLDNPFGLTEFRSSFGPLMSIRSKLSENKALTQDEVLALEAYFLQSEAGGHYEMSLARKNGEFTGALAEMAAEFGLNPASGLARRTLARMAAEVGKDGAMSLIRKSSRLARMMGYKGVDVSGLQVARNMGRVAMAALAEGATMSVTTQGLKNANVAAARMMAVRDGNGRLTGVARESDGNAFGKVFAGSALTNSAFVFPATFGEKVMRGLDGMSKTLRVPFGNPVDALVKMKSGEALSILSADAIGRTEIDPTWEDFANPKANGELVAGLLASELTMGMIKGAAGAAQGRVLRHNREKSYRRLMAEAYRGAAAFNPEGGANRLHDWESIVRAVSEGDESTIIEALVRTARDETMSREQREAVLDFARSAYRYVGAERAYEEWRTRGERERAAREAEDDWNVVDPQSLDDEYMLGYTAGRKAASGEATVRPEGDSASEGAAEGAGESGDSEGADGIVVRMKEALQIYEDAFGAESEYYRPQLDENPQELINDPALTEEQQNAVLYYINAKAALDGVMDAMEDHADERRAEAEREVARRTNWDTGAIMPATMKEDDRRVYIVKGEVAMLPDGSGVDVRRSSGRIVVMDAESGKYEFSSPEQIFSMGEAVDPQTELQSAFDIIEREQEAILSAASEGAAPAAEAGADAPAPEQNWHIGQFAG